MNHVAEGSLQAFLDGELSDDERSGVERHLLTCRECEATLAELHEASAVLEAALIAYDRPAPVEDAARAVRRRRAQERMAASRRALLRAAGLVLGFAAVGSAAIPGSPVRDWVNAAWQHGTALFDRPAVAEAEAPTANSAQSGISVQPSGGWVRIVVEAPAADLTARVRLVDNGRVSIRAFDGAAAAHFRTGPGRIDIVRPGAGELHIDVPSSVVGAVLEVDGRAIVTKEGTVLRAAGMSVEGDASTEVVVPLTAPVAGS
jgi:anti-sigma factor RsiW